MYALIVMQIANPKGEDVELQCGASSSHFAYIFGMCLNM